MLLLRAGLSPAPDAVTAWQHWWDLAGGLDGLDAGEFRLLPLVYRNLKAAGLEEPSQLGRLQGIYRQTWYRNRIAEARLFEVLDICERADIDAMVLKGMALVALAYGEQGVRPMNDIDLLVHGRDFRRAIAELQSLGWKFAQGNPGEELRFGRLFHAVLLRHPSGVELDLHRHILEESNWPGADKNLWQRGRAAELAGRHMRTLEPADHLIQVIVHGTRWDPVPPIRWIPDSVLLIRRQAIDWDLVVSESIRRGVTLAVAAALHFLRESFEPSIPADVGERLATAESTFLESVDFRLEQSGAGAMVHTGRYVTRYLRLTRGRSALDRAAGFPLYLRAMWGLEQAREIPLDAARRLWLRARGQDPSRK